MRDGGYVWWPAYREDIVIDIADRRQVPSHLVTVGLLTAVLCLPAVTRATGIRAAAVITMIGVHLVWFLVGAYVVAPVRTKRAANIMLAGNFVVNLGVAVAIPIATHHSRTPLWMLPVVYACLNGAMQEREPCITFLVAHGLSPLLAIVLLDENVPSSWSIAAPILCGVLCAVSYVHLASTSARWRQQRAEQDAALAALRARIAVRDRTRLMADLDASIGSTLAVVGMYADMIDQHVSRPDELRSLAATVRTAARTGLGDLRGMISAMAPSAGHLAGLADALRQATARAAEASELEIRVSLTGDPDVPIDGGSRFAVVRAFQTAIHAAKRGDARRVDVVLGSSSVAITLEITDDATEHTVDVGIVERVAELGGAYTRTPAPDRGSTVRISLPRPAG